MTDEPIKEFHQFVKKIGGEIADEIDKHVQARTKGYRKSNEALRKNLEQEKVKAAGAKAELNGQVQRAQEAEAAVKNFKTKLETSVKSLSAERDAIQSELDALRTVLSKIEREKRDAEIRATKAEQALQVKSPG